MSTAIGSYPAVSTSSILTEPSSFCASEGLSPQERLLFLFVLSELSRSDSAEASIDVSSERLQVLREEARKALAAAREAQEKSGFWGKIAQVLDGDIAAICQVVAVLASAVAGGAPAAIVLAAIAAGASLASRYGEELGLPPNVCVALGVAGGLCAAASGNFVSSTTALTGYRATAHTVKVGAQVTGAAATAAGSGARVYSGYHAGAAVDAHADARSSEHAQALAGMDIDAAVAELERSLERRTFLLEQGATFVDSDRRSAQAVLANWAGAA